MPVAAGLCKASGACFLLSSVFVTDYQCIVDLLIHHILSFHLDGHP